VTLRSNNAGPVRQHERPAELAPVALRCRKAPQPRIDITQPVERQPAYLRLADVAALLGKSVRTISSWEARGLLRVIRPAGGTPLVSRTEIERLLREGATNG
jgi:hypothetical protein